MGPRNRRRLTAAAVSLGLIAAIVVGTVLLTGGRNSGGHKSDRSGAGSYHHIYYTTRYLSGGDARYIAHYEHLAYGLTKAQVRRLVGPPPKIAGNCWEYPVHRVDSDGSSEKADKLCFYDGRYSQRYIQGNSGGWNAYD